MPVKSDSVTGKKYLGLLALAALGIVFGDIGTSPIYAFREALNSNGALDPNPENILGLLSLMLWSLIIVISIKYLTFVMRADNQGEGGIMALTALVLPPSKTRSKGRSTLALAGLFGAALLYGDGVITPAISVLSAVEGLEIATPLFSPYVIPLTLAIIVSLFCLQHKGTATVGMWFGPLTLCWFVTLAVLGICGITKNPGVIAAINPIHAMRFFQNGGASSFLVMGSIVLVVTGGEALYADMGHFGIKPIRLAWFFVVFPSLVLNYFGQGAMILHDPNTIDHPFFLMAPEWSLYPLVAIATVATIIASQAIISGTFSLTRQAIQLGYLPRMEIQHTSNKEIGQVYLPVVNWTLMVACIALVVGFRSSSNLASAYGVAVTTDMVVTSILFTAVAWKNWNWNPIGVFLLMVLILLVDMAFWGANLPKISDGGWFPLAVGAVIFFLMTAWKEGKQSIREYLEEDAHPVARLLLDVQESPVDRVPGTAVFMHKNPDQTPPAFLYNLKHNKVLHEAVALVCIKTATVPTIPERKRTTVKALTDDIHKIVIHYGFAESPDVPKALKNCAKMGLTFDMQDTTFFLSRETLILEDKTWWTHLKESLFAQMHRSAVRATYFNIPPERVVELGMPVKL